MRLVEATYHGAPTVVRTMHGRTDEFPIKEGLHQGSGLSPFLFIIVLAVISEEFRCGLPREIMFAYVLAVVADTEAEMQRSRLGWQIRTKKQHGGNESDGQQHERNTSKHQRQVNKSVCLGVTISEKVGPEEAERPRVRAVWRKWTDLSGDINDKKLARNLKIKLYIAVIRPVPLYDAECWTVRKKHEHIHEKTEMRMSRRIKGVTLRDKVKCMDNRTELGMNSVQEKVREMRLRCMDKCREWENTTK